MKTDDLINALVADQATRRPAISRTFPIAIGVGLAATVVLFAVMLGPRPGVLNSAMSSTQFLLKFVVTLGLAIPSYIIVRRLTRPDGEVSSAWLWLLAPLSVLSIWATYEMSSMPVEYWSSAAMGGNWAQCVKMIPLLSIMPLAGVLYALRDGAPSNPALAGAFGGLLSGALGATLYASHCSEDNALFVGLWYPIGIALMTLIGALLAVRIARW